MGKSGTSKKPRKSKRKLLTVHVPYSDPVVKDVQLTIENLWECIRLGDAETFRDVLSGHLKAVNKVDFVEKSGIGRRTLYDLLDPTRKFNPEFETLSAIIKGLEAA